MDNNQRTGSDMLDDLTSFIFESDELPSIDKANELLAKEGVDSDALNTWVLEKMVGVRARRSLVAAREKRLRLTESLENCRAKVAQSGSSIREEILSRLKTLSSSDPDAALVYCRRFEETPDEDLPELEAELAFLDEVNNEGTTGQSSKVD